MFVVGDRVVYPMYGAGEIEDIETKEIDGEEKNYYVINIPNGSLKIRISVTKAPSLGLRYVSDIDFIEKSMRDVSLTPVEMHDNWNQRYKTNMEKMKTGKLVEVATVVRNLLVRENEKGLSGAEKKMLNNARQIVISEIVYSQGNMEKDAAEKFMSEALFSK